MTIYFDNNATTRPHPEVVTIIREHLESTWGNPSSVHHPGRLARRAIEEAREQIALLIGAEPSEIIFTSGGTESNNAAIFGRAAGSVPERFHIVTTTIEHPSVRAVVAALESRGCPVSWVSPDSSGKVSADDVIGAIEDSTSLVTVMTANNETGVVQPVAEVSRACRDRGIPFHTDAVQAIGKIPVIVEQMPVDSLALSAHKFYGPKGIGALYVRKGSAMEPFVLGGSQERRRRGGTENVPLAAGIGKAAELAAGELDRQDSIRALRDDLERKVTASIANVVVNGGDAAKVTLPEGDWSVTFASEAGTATVEGTTLSVDWQTV
ncbi:MAG: cysteine desulfurase family protein, partial [Thermoanaerobaculia bacterium]|nr:cysteine desulfurase family protein [Thermoanaerobaculia bacterium]